MSGSPLRNSQMEMANFLRNPDSVSPPANVEPRRLKIYQDLIYNNIEGFISGGFPVLRSLYAEDDWHELVRMFIDGHRCHSPYFLEISQEFLRFAMEEFVPRECDPPFLAELAHYEWVELALDVSEDELPARSDTEDLMASIPFLSPLAWLLSYQYPVHQIGPGYQPDEALDPTYLVVYRDYGDSVNFMQLNAATARLLELIRDNGATGKAITAAATLNQLAGELNMPAENLQEFGVEQLSQFRDQSIIYTESPEN